MNFSLPNSYQNILITGGSGFIGGHLICWLLKNSSATIFNLDKLAYSSDQKHIEREIKSYPNFNLKRYKFLNIDLKDFDKTRKALEISNPDLIMHLAAESHVDRSIDNSKVFIESNIIGTYNLLELAREHWTSLPLKRQINFRFHHISTDEVFGSLGKSGKFNEMTRYNPRSPYSASKAASDHLVSAWHHTYKLPVVLTNCSNNYGPWQFPEKLIPLVVIKALRNEPIPIYGDGKNIRDWLFVTDHIEALLLCAIRGKLGSNYCIGGFGEEANINLVKSICTILNEINPRNKGYENLISFVADRPGHDKRYSIDSSLIRNELGWQPKVKLLDGLKITVKWYLENFAWHNELMKRSNYDLKRLGR